MKKILLIDAFSLLFRAFYATVKKDGDGTYQIKGKSVEDKPSNAIRVFVSSLKNILRHTKPDYMLICFDSKVKSFRHQFNFYKSNRKETPALLIAQIEPLKKVLNILGYSWTEMDGYEADDIIGAIAKRFKHQYRIQVVSGDKDLFQLIDKNVTVLYPNQQSSKPYENIDLAGFARLFSDLKPRQLIDLKALTGDKSDNIPGVWGIAENGAKKLLTQYKTVEEIYKSIEEIKNKNTKTKLINGKEMAFISKRIATIMEDFETHIEIKDMVINNVKVKELLDFINEYKLFTFKGYLPKQNNDKKIVAKTESTNKDARTTRSWNSKKVAPKERSEQKNRKPNNNVPTNN